MVNVRLVAMLCIIEGVRFRAAKIAHGWPFIAINDGLRIKRPPPTPLPPFHVTLSRTRNKTSSLAKAITTPNINQTLNEGHTGQGKCLRGRPNHDQITVRNTLDNLENRPSDHAQVING